MALADGQTIPYREATPGTVFTSRLDKKIKPVPPEQNTLSKGFLAARHRVGQNRGAAQEALWHLAGIQLERGLRRRWSTSAMGLLKLGLEAGDTLAIIGENDPEMYWAQIAAHALRCKTCCVFSDASPQDIHYVINSTDATVVCAHDQEQVDKMLELKASNAADIQGRLLGRARHVEL